MRERQRELRRQRARRMKRLKLRLREQMAQAGTVQAERAVEKQKSRMKKIEKAEDIPAESTEQK
jgi:hypothetical protein